MLLAGTECDSSRCARSSGIEPGVDRRGVHALITEIGVCVVAMRCYDSRYHGKEVVRLVRWLKTGEWRCSRVGASP